MPPAAKKKASSSSPSKKPEASKIDTLAEFNEFVKDTTQKVNESLDSKRKSGDDSASTLQFVTDTILRNQFRSAKWTP